MSNERELIVWSVAWGEYSFMLQSLVSSLRRTGFKGRIVVFADKPIKDAEYRPLDSSIELDQLQFWKFEYLCKHMAKEPGKNLVFIDSDHYVVRNVSELLPKLFDHGPWHSFLEGSMNTQHTRRADWWSCPNAEFVSMCRDFGVMQSEIRNSNGGFWGVTSEFAETSKRVAHEFHEFARKRGHVFPEEVSIAVMTHMFTEDHSARFAEKWLHMWGTEWTGALADKVPDGNPWKLVNYMSGEASLVNPAIVHAMRSKNALINLGRSIAGDSVILAEPQQVTAGTGPAPTSNAPKPGCSACARKKQAMLEAAAKAKLEESMKEAQNKPIVEVQAATMPAVDPESVQTKVLSTTQADVVTEETTTSAPKQGGLISRLKGMIKG